MCNRKSESAGQKQSEEQHRLSNAYTSSQLLEPLNGSIAQQVETAPAENGSSPLSFGEGRCVEGRSQTSEVRYRGHFEAFCGLRVVKGHVPLMLRSWAFRLIESRCELGCFIRRRDYGWTAYDVLSSVQRDTMRCLGES